MSILYAISDIHGFYDSMIDSLQLVDLSTDKENKLIFLGDYIDRGPNSFQVLSKIYALEKKYSDQVIVLLGNHETWFLEWCLGEGKMKWLSQDAYLKTVKSAFSKEQWEEEMFPTLYSQRNSYDQMNQYLKDKLLQEHSDLIQWLASKQESLYYETPNQIFVHAGIEEVSTAAAPDYWKTATSEDTYVWKYPPTNLGKYFYKDIIVGHTSSAETANKRSYLGKVFWDGASHYFIDGQTNTSGIVPLLKYDTETREYSSFEKQPDNNWQEYKISKIRE